VANDSDHHGRELRHASLDKTRSVLRLNDLGMPLDTHEAYSKIVRAPFGMVPLRGPTGSGKTTTLYATLSEVSNPR